MTTISETLKIHGSESVNMMSHETSSFVDPYSLLGVNINSQIEEVRRAYYDLSLICHPDKGGCSTDMACLQAAYQFVKEGIQATGASKVSVGRFEELLEDYRVGLGVPQRFAEIERPAFRFVDRMNGEEACSFDHEAFESLPDTQVIRSTIRQAPSIPFIFKEEVDPITDQVSEKGAGPSHASITALVICSPVKTRDLFLDWQLDETNKSAMEEFDFGTDAPMNMFDYGTAFATDTTVALSDPREKRTCLEDILKEREELEGIAKLECIAELEAIANTSVQS